MSYVGYVLLRVPFICLTQNVSYAVCNRNRNRKKQFVTSTKSMNKNIESAARAVTRWPNNNHSLKAVLK